MQFTDPLSPPIFLALHESSLVAFSPPPIIPRIYEEPPLAWRVVVGRAIQHC